MTDFAKGDRVRVTIEGTVCRRTLAHQMQELGGAVALLLRPLVQMIERLLCRLPGGATMKPVTVRRCPWCGEVVPHD